MKVIWNLQQPSVQDTSLAGGKGASLGELAQAGLPVPPGFVLTVDAYRAFLRANGLERAIAGILRRIDPGDIAVLERAAADVAGRLASGRMPDEVADQVRQAYAELASPQVAVRSSATAEDLPHSSFAGQYATFLNVAGEEAVSQAIVGCWASLWTARALAYRAQRGIAHDDVAMAVVVQQMVDAKASGVLFTANPVTGDPDEMTIDAAPGPGEGVVGGTVTPEEVVADRHTGEVVRRSGVLHRVLSDAQVAGLVCLGEQIEACFGCPQDIEWAWADGRFHVLQARPITTPVRPRLSWEPPERGARYVRGGMMELLPDPVSVLFETLGLPAFERAIKAYQERLGLGPAMQGWGFAVINGYVYGVLRLSLGMALEAIRALPVLLGHASQVTPTPQSWREEALPAYRQAVAALEGDPGALSGQALLERIEALTLACGRYWAVFAALVPQLDRAERRFERLYCRIRKKGDADAFHPPEAAVLLRGLENRPLEADRALYAAGQEGMDATIAQYSHALYSLDFAVPLAGEDRAALQAMQRAWAAGAPPPDERHAHLAAEREDAARRLRERLSSRQRRMFDERLETAQQAAQVREDALFDLALAWVPLRRYALELGSRLVEAGALAGAEQVFWLRRDELASLLDALDRAGRPLASLAEQAEARRTEREAARGARVPFAIPERKVKGLLRAFVPTAEARRQVAGDVLSGTGASPGRVTAVARVIAGPEAFGRLGKGEILVAHATTPAWTPLFALAGGLVADLGGALSHGSIVAREYGIPAVMGTGNATERIRDGQAITVDGTAGKVYLA
jgi:phosphohistidine swiveling domain-containing protein